MAPTVVISARGEERLRSGHPWIYRADVANVRAAAGDLVQIRGPRGRTLGSALYSDRSQIALRMLSYGDAPGDEALIRRRLEAAIAFRTSLALDATAFRLVHGEADLLPSLIVDRYGDYLVVQTLSQGMDRRKGEIVQALTALLQPKGILERNDPKVRQLEGLESQVGVLFGEVPEQVEVVENGVVYLADLYHGQKTGLFLDQRENHAAARAYAHGRVLDGFTYHGGFALQVASAASEVLAVDASGEALERLKANAERNGVTNVQVKDANLFDLLHDLDGRGERFDTVILDPPAFAKSKDAVDKAKRGYKEINLRGLRLLRPGGCLVTCSCSYHVHEEDFEAILASAAVDARATVTVVEKRRQARDHPVVLGVPETYYLKCFILRRLE
jgi:23S rRNA (cytosine1962-C5)-methyltransferase